MKAAVFVHITVFFAVSVSSRRAPGVAEVRLPDEGAAAVPEGTLPRSVVFDVFVVVDTSVASYFNRSASDVMSYAAETINGVTLVFASGFDRVQVRLRLVNVFMPSRKTEGKVLALTESNKIDGERTLHRLQGYAKEVLEASKADVVLLLTGRSIHSENAMTPLRLVPGLANERSVCTERKVAVVRDAPGTHLGIDAAATVIGQVLGASYRGEPKCGHGDDDIFSTCAQENMADLFMTLERSCFLTTRKYVKEFLAPGLSLDEERFCRAALPGRHRVHNCSTEEDMKNCVVRCCSPGNHTAKAFTAPDGKECVHDEKYDRTKVCYRGTCDVSLSALEEILQHDDHRGAETDNNEDAGDYDDASPVFIFDDEDENELQ